MDKKKIAKEGLHFIAYLIIAVLRSKQKYRLTDKGRAFLRELERKRQPN